MPSHLSVALRFLLACTLLMVLANRYGDALIERLLPLYQWEIGLIEDRYRILNLGFDKEGADRVIRLQVTLAKPIFIGTNYLLPDERGLANASTLAGNVLQPVILLLAVLVSLPTKRTWNYGFRLFGAIPMLALILTLDVPLVLIASIWKIILQHLAPDTSSALILWSTFLQGGGIWVLGLVGGVVVVWAESLLHPSK